MKSKPIKLCGVTISPGEKITLALPTPELYTCSPMHIPIHIIHGKKKGPCLLICGTVHGDETNSIIIIQNLLQTDFLKKGFRGTLITIPVLNVYGLVAQTRDLPGGKDLEQNFPGSKTGSFASRLAYLINHEILQHADYCIDLRSGELPMKKFPQIWTNLDIAECKDAATAFEAPVIMDTKNEEGFLFLHSKKSAKIVPTLVYEGGESLRLNEFPIKVGIKGIFKLMKHLNMFSSPVKSTRHTSVIFEAHEPIYSPASGICQFFKKIGSYVKKQELLAKIVDPFGTKQVHDILSPNDGIIITQRTSPLINEGETILEIGLLHQKLEQVPDFKNWKY